MSTLDKHQADIARWLMYPILPSDVTRAEFAIEVIDYLVTDLNETDQPWFLITKTISLEAGKALYKLDNYETFGKARYLYTASDDDSNQTAFDRRNIPLVSLEMLTENFGGGDVGSQTIDAPGGTAFSDQYPMAAAAYYRLSEPMGNVLEFGPVPSRTQQVTFIYEPDVVRPNDRSQGFRFNQFDGYVATLAALNVLPQTEWGDIRGNIEARTARRADIHDSLLRMIGAISPKEGYAYQFWSFKNRLNASASPVTIGWAADRI